MMKTPAFFTSFSTPAIELALTLNRYFIQIQKQLNVDIESLKIAIFFTKLGKNLADIPQIFHRAVGVSPLFFTLLSTGAFVVSEPPA